MLIRISILFNCSMSRLASEHPYRKYSILTNEIFSCSSFLLGSNVISNFFIYLPKNSSASWIAYGPKCILLLSSMRMNSVPSLSNPALMLKKVSNSYRSFFMYSLAGLRTSYSISSSKLMVVLARRFSASVSSFISRSFYSSAWFFYRICLSNSVS